MDKYTVRINLSRIEEEHIWTNDKGERFISCNVVLSHRVWDDGGETHGFVTQWWKDTSLPPGEYIKEPRLGSLKKLGSKPQAPKSDSVPF